MKTGIIIFTILIIMLVAVVIMKATTEKHVTSKEVVVMHDITDPEITKPNITDIPSIFNLNNSKWDGASFRFMNITDVSYNRTHETRINAENEWLGNEFEREKKVKQFFADIAKILSEANNESPGKENSSVYLPIARELNRLSQSTSLERELLVYSDLKENTDDFSLYQDRYASLLKVGPEKVRNYFETLIPLKTLKGIKVYLIYQPANKEEDKEFRLISSIYKKMLEDKGATVEIMANVNL